MKFQGLNIFKSQKSLRSPTPRITSSVVLVDLVVLVVPVVWSVVLRWWKESWKTWKVASKETLQRKKYGQTVGSIRLVYLPTNFTIENKQKNLCDYAVWFLLACHWAPLRGLPYVDVLGMSLANYCIEKWTCYTYTCYFMVLTSFKYFLYLCVRVYVSSS